MRKALRILGTVLVVGGVATLLWVVVVWQWQDPFTALYTRWEQHKLASSYDERFTKFRPLRPAGDTLAAERRTIALEAARYRRVSKRGEAIGRIKVPRLGLNMILVNGTDHETLQKGPGRDLRTYMPGQGQLVYIAGHRTTYLAPFSHIDSLRRGDPVTLELPYATFVYRIVRHRIVRSDDLSVLRSHGHEVVILQACHPRFFATHRYLAYATPVRVVPRVGAPYSPGQGLAAAR
ncbi:MAG TPA: sortase [Gaiellaceae bacterium]|jgi:sortase A|nr:sortase [Gaiellaceae bacterium]